MPFSDGFFDLVVVYGVLEWAGLSGEEQKPEFYQLKLLKEVQRVLKKGGHLYLAIENRLGIVYLLGQKDPHTNLRFVTLMPRFLANIYSRVVRGKPYRAYTHTLGDCKRLFKKAGFSDIETYTPLPSYRHFWYVLPLDEPKIMSYFLEHLSQASTPLARILLKLARKIKLLNLIRLFVPDYSFIVKK